MIAIIDGCGANFTSIQYALERLGKKSIVTRDAKKIQSATLVILPGVGTAKHAMQQLHQSNLIEVIINLKQPVLGICLGMQLLFQHSMEGQVNCLGILPGVVESLEKTQMHNENLSIPHMGWNQLHLEKINSPLLQEIEDRSYVYYANSFAVAMNETTQAVTYYDVPFSAVVQKNNFFGVQFHPERSGKIGRKILENFVNRV